MNRRVPTPYYYSRTNWRGETSEHDWYIVGDVQEEDEQDDDGRRHITETSVAIVPGNATSHPVCEHTAAFLCHAANCHESLLMALENIVAVVKEPVEESGCYDEQPSYRTQDDAILAELLFDARAAVARAHERPLSAHAS